MDAMIAVKKSTHNEEKHIFLISSVRYVMA